ncbi:uncharacterized protein TNCV_2032521 [Trichonephila clavipes]|nr:uncharacterized protein TNCV_2032521 [Trichonephila clavipes]
MIPDVLNYGQIWGSGCQGRVVTLRRQSCDTLAVKGRIEVFTTEPPLTNTIFITAEIESGFVAKDDLVPFRCSPVSSCKAQLQTEASMGGRQGSTYNGCHDPKCLSARRLRMVREDIGALNEGATCVWMAADEAVGCTHAFLTMWRSSR